MRLFDRFKRGELRLTRVEAFSDGVFAIVVTLLVLELKVPALRHFASPADLAHQLVELMPKFLSWLISFIIVCKFWLNHNHILTLARHADEVVSHSPPTRRPEARRRYLLARARRQAREPRPLVALSRSRSAPALPCRRL